MSFDEIRITKANSSAMFKCYDKHYINYGI